MIRKAVYRDHYPESDSEIWAVHMGGYNLDISPSVAICTNRFVWLTGLFKFLDHCIDHLRQYIMCAADATFIPRSATYLTGSSSFGMMPEARPLQMCRDFGALRRWMRDRGWDGAKTSHLEHNILRLESDTLELLCLQLRPMTRKGKYLFNHVQLVMVIRLRRSNRHDNT
jgi:hypothetical protein